jgi:hypothetical protein
MTRVAAGTSFSRPLLGGTHNNVEQNGPSLIDLSYLFRDFRGPFQAFAAVGETTISTLTLPASALNAALSAAEVSPTIECDFSVPNPLQADRPSSSAAATVTTKLFMTNLPRKFGSTMATPVTSAAN